MMARIKRIEQKLDEVLLILKSLVKENKEMDTAIQALIDQAHKNTDAEAAAVAAINALAAKLAAAIANATLSDADRATLNQEVTDMQTSAAAIAAAVVANTPAAPPAAA